MRLHVDPSSDTAPFEQLRLGIVALIESGELAPGTRLPTVRALAAELGLAPNTVARAYRELQHDEVIETRGRGGSFVPVAGDEAQRQARSAAREFVERIRMLGISDDDGVALVVAAMGATAAEE